MQNLEAKVPPKKSVSCLSQTTHLTRGKALWVCVHSTICSYILSARLTFDKQAIGRFLARAYVRQFFTASIIS
jgi:hypothetical protein